MYAWQKEGRVPTVCENEQEMADLRAQIRLQKAPESAILAEIRKFQNAQKRYPATSEIHADLGKQLAPLFAEMARRTA